MFEGMGDLLGYGAGALGLIGVIYFIITNFFGGDNKIDKLKDKIRKEKENKIKKKQEEINNKEKEIKELENLANDKQEEINNKIKDVKKKQEETEKLDNVKDTTNKIDESW